MGSDTPLQITQFLRAWRQGDQAALDSLIPLVDQELRRIAKHYLRREHPGHTLETTALVNEAYLRLIDIRQVDWQDRAHFFGICARLMRQILVDHARVHRASKRGGGQRFVSLDEALEVAVDRSSDLAAIDDALSALAKVDRRKEQVVELRFFGGLSVEETAEVLSVSPETVMRDWRLAKVWLMRELSRAAPDGTTKV